VHAHSVASLSAAGSAVQTHCVWRRAASAHMHTMNVDATPFLRCLCPHTPQVARAARHAKAPAEGPAAQQGPGESAKAWRKAVLGRQLKARQQQVPAEGQEQEQQGQQAAGKRCVSPPSITLYIVPPPLPCCYKRLMPPHIIHICTHCGPPSISQMHPIPMTCVVGLRRRQQQPAGEQQHGAAAKRSRTGVQPDGQQQGAAAPAAVGGGQLVFNALALDADAGARFPAVHAHSHKRQLAVLGSLLPYPHPHPQ
jgi:hypothetical protein